MTKKQMENAGFYRNSEKGYPHRWSISTSYDTLEFNIPFLEGADIKSLIEQAYEIGLRDGKSAGKIEKAEEIKKLLYINH